MTGSRRPRLPLAVALLATCGALADSGPARRRGGPRPRRAPDEGDTPLLRDVLEAAGRSYVQAKTALANTRKRQARLTAELRRVEGRIAELAPEVEQVARTGRTGPAGSARCWCCSTALAGGLPEAGPRAGGGGPAGQRPGCASSNQARDRAPGRKRPLDAEIAEERRQLAVMLRQKQAAEQALALVGGAVTGGFVSATHRSPRPAPRDADGSWPPQTCSIRRPDHQRLHHPAHPARVHTRHGGRLHPVRRLPPPGGPFEHPKGRACDFSPQPAAASAATPPATTGVRQQPRRVLRPQRRPAGHAVRHLVPADLVPGDRLEVVRRGARRPVQRPHQPRTPVAAVAPPPSAPPPSPGCGYGSPALARRTGARPARLLRRAARSAAPAGSAGSPARRR